MNTEICKQETPSEHVESPSFSQKMNENNEIKINKKQVVFVVVGSTGKDNLKKLSDRELSFFNDLPFYILPDEAFNDSLDERKCAVDHMRWWRNDAQSPVSIYSGDEKYIEIIEREIYKRFTRVVDHTSHSIHKMEKITHDEIIRSLEKHTRDKVEHIFFHEMQVVEIFFASGREETLNINLFAFLCGFKSMLILPNNYDECGADTDTGNINIQSVESNFIIR